MTNEEILDNLRETTSEVLSALNRDVVSNSELLEAKEPMKRTAASTDDRRANAVPRFKVTDARKKALKTAGSKSRRIAPAK